MAKYLDLSATVSVSMTELIGAKPAQEQNDKAEERGEDGV